MAAEPVLLLADNYLFDAGYVKLPVKRDFLAARHGILAA